MPKIRKKTWTIAPCLLLLFLSACAEAGVAESSPDADDPRFEFVASDRSRDRSPQCSAEDLSRLTGDNASFAFDLYRELRHEEGNLLYSPHSLSEALAMLYAGSVGQTRQEMKETLHFTLAEDRLHSAFNFLDLELASRGEAMVAEPGGEPPVRLIVANSLWSARGSHLLPSFLDTLARNYGAGVRQLDFRGDPDGSRIVINQWIEEKTYGRLRDMVPPGDLISPITVLVLVNAVYFKAKWAQPFDENATTQADFHLLDGTTSSVAMMEFNDPEYGFDYAAGDGWQAIDLPYLTMIEQISTGFWHELSMLVLIPDEGRFAEFDNKLDYASLQSMDRELSYTSVHLFFPRFSFESYFKLKPILSDMGMPSMFLGGLDGIDGGAGRLYVRDVLHKAWISVDEKGTEAAAATSIGVESAGAEPILLRIDRPFIFLIRDVDTGAILFIGRVLDPSASPASRV